MIYYDQTIIEDDKGYMTTSAIDVLQIFTILNHEKLRGCEIPISLIKAKSTLVFSRRRNTMEIALLLANVP